MFGFLRKRLFNRMMENVTAIQIVTCLKLKNVLREYAIHLWWGRRGGTGRMRRRSDGLCEEDAGLLAAAATNF